MESLGACGLFPLGRLIVNFSLRLIITIRQALFACHIEQAFSPFQKKILATRQPKRNQINCDIN